MEPGLPSSSVELQHLREALEATRSEVAEMERLLEDLPEIFERKFRERLQPLLDQQHHLLDETAGLRQQVLLQNSIQPKAQLLLLPQPTSGQRSWRASRNWLKALVGLSPGADEQPTAGSAGPTRR